MKLIMKLLALLLLAVLPLSLSAQGTTVILEYMKVPPGMEEDYLQVEMAWKKVHEKRIEAGICSGWQLWRNVYAAADDPYQFITINWYNNWKHSFSEAPEGFWEENSGKLFSDEEWAKLWEMTATSRTIARKDVMHQVMAADNSKGASYILVNRMKVKPGGESDYVKLEQEFAKPLQEEAIRRGQLSHWGVWVAWPFDDASMRYTTVDGYESIEQLTADGENLLPVVHPDLDPDEIAKKVNKVRTMASRELWELVDAVFPQAGE